MTNMSYCRFENTLNDLRDCKDQLEMLLAGDADTGAMSSLQERRARIQLIVECYELVELFKNAGIDGDEADLQRVVERVVQENEDAIPESNED